MLTPPFWLFQFPLRYCLVREPVGGAKGRMRMRIKLLCRKYHADKCGAGAAFTGEEVSRDLVALLSDEYGVR